MRSTKAYWISDDYSDNESSDDDSTLKSTLDWNEMTNRLKNFNAKTGFHFSPMKRMEGGFMHKDSKSEIHIRFLSGGNLRRGWHFPYLDGSEIDPSFTVLKRGEDFHIIWKLINGKLTKKAFSNLEHDFIDCFGFTRKFSMRRRG